MRKNIKFTFNGECLVLRGKLPKKAGELWVDYQKEITKNTTRRMWTNYIVGEREYSLLPIHGNDPQRAWIEF